jgi:hypothetical protein
MFTDRREIAHHSSPLDVRINAPRGAKDASAMGRPRATAEPPAKAFVSLAEQTLAGRSDMVDEYESERPIERPVERTTIVETGDRGGGGMLAVVLLIIVVLALLFLFRDQLGFGSSKTEVSIPDKIEVNVN